MSRYGSNRSTFASLLPPTQPPPWMYIRTGVGPAVSRGRYRSTRFSKLLATWYVTLGMTRYSFDTWDAQAAVSLSCASAALDGITTSEARATHRAIVTNGFDMPPSLPVAARVEWASDPA